MDINSGAFRLARNASKYSDHRVKVGACVVKNGKPVSVGFNICKTHPQYTKGKVRSLHAEIRAIINSATDLAGSTIYIYRQHKNGNPALARPCELCQEIIQDAGIKWMIYTTDKYPYWRREHVKRFY